MRTTITPAMALVALAAAPLAARQNDAPAGTIGQVIEVDPLNGHAGPFEAGVRRHLEHEAKAGATWEWAGFEIVMGERTGQYMFGSFNHTYADFDTPDTDPQASAASIDQNIAPHVADAAVSLIRFFPELSLFDPDAAPSPLYEVLTFQIGMDGDEAFRHFLGKLKTTFETAGLPIQYHVYQFAQGGPSGGGTWVVSIPHANFASMGGGGDGGDMQGLTEQVLGRFESRQLWDMANHSITSMRSEVFALRPDLSLNLTSN